MNEWAVVSFFFSAWRTTLQLQSLGLFLPFGFGVLCDESGHTKFPFSDVLGYSDSDRPEVLEPYHIKASDATDGRAGGERGWS